MHQMSGFRRTKSGLSNQHLFYDVDVVLYLEGGSKSFNKQEAYEDNYSNETEDIIFWKNIFDRFRTSTKIKYKSIGSKTTVKEIAIDIIEGDIKTVFVAMDNEFDEILNKRINHPNVFYTNGYSWENDVWGHQVIKKIIEELSAIKIDNNDIEENFANFLTRIKLAVYSDAYLFKSGSSFFPRQQGLLFCVDCRPVDLPLVKTENIENKIVEKGLTRRKAIRYGNKEKLDPHKFCYGHFLADYCCQVIQHYLKKRHSLNSVQKDVMYRMGIKKHFELYFETSDAYTYYKERFEQNVA